MLFSGLLRRIFKLSAPSAGNRRNVDACWANACWLTERDTCELTLADGHGYEMFTRTVALRLFFSFLTTGERVRTRRQNSPLCILKQELLQYPLACLGVSPHYNRFMARRFVNVCDLDKRDKA